MKVPSIQQTAAGISILVVAVTAGCWGGRIAARLDQLEPAVEQLKSTVGRLDPSVEQLKSTVDQLEPTVEQLESTVDRLERAAGDVRVVQAADCPVRSVYLGRISPDRVLCR